MKTNMKTHQHEHESIHLICTFTLSLSSHLRYFSTATEQTKCCTQGLIAKQRGVPRSDRRAFTWDKDSYGYWEEHEEQVKRAVLPAQLKA